VLEQPSHGSSLPVEPRYNRAVDYTVRYRAIRDDKIMCEVVGLDEQRRPTGPIVAKGTGNSKPEAKAAALAATADPAIRSVIEGAPV
jgi:hypothetical protein